MTRVHRPQDHTAPLSLVVLTFNEERNIAACLDSAAGLAAEIFVVDSGSTDRTAALATARGATVVTHPFESHAKRWQWALDTLPLANQWILALDADQRLTPELRDEIASMLPGWSGVTGAFISRRQIFRGHWIRHGGYYPKYLLKLFRRDAARIDEADLVDHHFIVHGPTRLLREDLVEDNQNERDLSAWIAKHHRYARLQALEERSRWREGRLNESANGRAGVVNARLFGTPDERTLFCKQIWNRLPLFIRPFAYFFYRYVLRLGFLDGAEGFVFHSVQAFWYRLLVDIHRAELPAEHSMNIP